MKKLPLVLSLAGFLGLASANAQLAHRYSMTDANDSVGGANGTVAGNADFINGQLVTGGASGDFLSLPTAVGTGITGSFSVQTFVTITANPNNFSSLFSLSSPGNRNFFLVNPSRPNANGNLSANFQQKVGVVNGGPDTEVDLQAGGSFPFGAAQHDVAITYVSSTNVVTVYLDGTQVASGSIAAALSGASLNLETLTSLGANGVNGGGPFGDQSINGSTNDFRIFSSALTPTQVTALDLAGADASNAAIAALVPEPSTWVMMLLSVAALCGFRRLRSSRA